jgi:hypothetical protein
VRPLLQQTVLVEAEQVQGVYFSGLNGVSTLCAHYYNKLF